MISPLVVAAIPSFIDFASYEATISKGWGWEKYKTEPVSAFLLMLAYYSSLGAFELYLMSWICAGVGFLIVMRLEGRAKASLYLFLVLNPVALVLLQFSRQYFAYLFFLLALLCVASRVNSRVSLALSLLSHNASAPFSFLIYQLIRVRPFFFFVGLSASAVLFVVFSNLFFPEHINYEGVRGRGRALIVVSSFLFFMLMSLKRPKALVLLFLLMLFFLFSYYITPQAGRFASYFIAFVACYGVFTFNSFASILAIHLFFFMNILVSFAIVLFGLYGFG